MNRVCIVTNEIYPLDRGGIARLAWNFANENLRRGRPAELHFLLPASFHPRLRQIESEFHGLAKIHLCSESLRVLGPLGKLLQQHGAGDSLDFHMLESLRYLAGLLDAQREIGRDFDIVEFPDFGGWAAAAVAARRCGLALTNTRIAVRLHSSFGLIVRHEPFMHEGSDWMAGICDLERQSLVGADLVVAHIQSTAELNREHFGFGQQWLQRVRVEMPPITLHEAELAAQKPKLPGAPPRDFLFSSRLQAFKRPDLFVRAAVHLLESHDCESMFRVVSYGWDRDYIDWLKRLVPPRWRRQIQFLDEISPQARARILGESILVIPSDFESLCLLAYEARQLGVKLILNRRCLAFGAEPELWREGRDCLFFDGDFKSLAETMRLSLDWQPQPAPGMAAVRPYWELPMPPDRTSEPGPLSLSCIVYGDADLERLGWRIGALKQSFAGVDVHVLAPRDAFRSSRMAVAAWQMLGIAVHLTSWNDPTPTEIFSVVRAASGDAVAFVPNDVEIEPGLWSMAAECLARHPQVDVVTSPLGQLAPEAARRFTLNYGAAPTVALLADRVAHRASVFRRSALLEFGLREEAGDRWHEDLCQRLVAAGHDNIVVAPALMASRHGSRQSRISSSKFFATLRDDAGQRNGTPYRQGSASTGYIDSFETVDHATWVARGEQTAAEAVEPAPFQFKSVMLKNHSAGEDGGYAELEIALEGLQIGAVPVEWLAFKLIRSMGEAQLEFRDGGNARRFFRDWPPTTSDQWGPLAVWCAQSTPHPHRVFFDKAGYQDTRRLKLLLASLPEIILSLPLSERERAQWLKMAHELHSL